jgi:hypothetical protein
MVVVVEGEEFEARKGPVTGARKTNNTGEVMAVQQAIRWAVEQEQSVRIRYDSEYAANMVQGKWKCKKNGQLIREARQEYMRAAQMRGTCKLKTHEARVRHVYEGGVVHGARIRNISSTRWFGLRGPYTGLVCKHLVVFLIYGWAINVAPESDSRHATSIYSHWDQV